MATRVFLPCYWDLSGTLQLNVPKLARRPSQLVWSDDAGRLSDAARVSRTQTRSGRPEQLWTRLTP